MKLTELLSILPKTEMKWPDMEVDCVTSDSRKVTRNSVFVCIQGAADDGHRYAKNAAAQGALCVICEKDTELSNQIIVEDSHAVYATLCAAMFGYPARKLKLIGVTGTNGKTTVTYLVKHILEENGRKTGLIGTIRNMIGDKEYPAANTTPDAWELQMLLSRMVEEKCEYVVMEVSSHALDQQRVYGCTFEAAVFTNLTQDHLDYHKTMESYSEAKQKLFAISKKAVVNLDDPYAPAMTKGMTGEVKSYGIERQDADYKAQNIRLYAGGVGFELVSEGASARIQMPMPGYFSVGNAMAAVGAALSLGLPFAAAAKALSCATGVKGRMEVVETPGDYTVIIDYAHTPDGLIHVLQALKETTEGRLIAVFGCGGDRDRAKRPLMGRACAEGADLCIVTSDNPRSENPMDIIEQILEGMRGYGTPKVVVENRREAIEYALQRAQPGDVILLAGKGHETYQVLDGETIHFDERDIVRAIVCGQ